MKVVIDIAGSKEQPTKNIDALTRYIKSRPLSLDDLSLIDTKCILAATREQLPN